MNTVNLTGILVGEPDLKYINHCPAARFAVEVSRTNGRIDEIQCATYEKAATLFFGDLKSGDGVEIVGYLASINGKMEVIAKYIKPLGRTASEEKDPMIRGLQYATPINRVRE